ncbi:MAG: MFS transporter [Parvularculales bacterium]
MNTDRSFSTSSATEERHKPFPSLMTLYMTGQSSWYMSLGLQFVLFPWLAAFVLEVPAHLVGIAQMSLMAPSLVFMLFGGAVADQNDARRLLVWLHTAAIMPPLGLALVMSADSLSYSAIIAYALAMGTLGAFAMPARDALLTRIAGGAIQKAVTLAMMMQFSSQLVGMLIAGLADQAGAVPFLLGQAVVMALGAVATLRMPSFPPHAETTPLRARFQEIKDGLTEVTSSPLLLPVVMLMAAIGVCYIGPFLVVLPLMVRDIYEGDSGSLAIINICFWGGVIFITAALLRIGGVHHIGRVLSVSVSSGAVVLALMAIPSSFTILCILCIFWGMGAGITMSLTRTIVQQASPASHRARILSVYQLGFAGGGPIGALTMGYLVDALGITIVTLVPALTMGLMLTYIIARTRLISITATDLDAPSNT